MVKQEALLDFNSNQPCGELCSSNMSIKGTEAELVTCLKDILEEEGPYFEEIECKMEKTLGDDASEDDSTKNNGKKLLRNKNR